MPAAQRQQLQQRSNAAGLARLFGHVAVILLLGSLIALKVPGWPLLLLLQGIVMAFLFNLQHECTHKTPFRTEWLNEWVGWISGFIIVQPFLWFRYFHYAHHRYTNDPQRDPELVGVSKPKTRAEYVAFVVAIRYSIDKLRLLSRNAFADITDDYVPESARMRLRTEARVMLALYVIVVALAVMSIPILFWVWFVPLLLGFPFLKLYHLAEHGLCPMVENKFINTRTVRTQRLVLFFTWNMPYHIEHHLLPGVPFHQLPNLHKLVKQHLQQTSSGYLSFTRSYARTLL
jgi:fatty acid desaturase